MKLSEYLVKVPKLEHQLPAALDRAKQPLGQEKARRLAFLYEPKYEKFLDYQFAWQGKEDLLHVEIIGNELDIFKNVRLLPIYANSLDVDDTRKTSWHAGYTGEPRIDIETFAVVRHTITSFEALALKGLVEVTYANEAFTN
jgi:hypothetical protein